MTYWHMQLHPDEKDWGREKELLDTKSLIGLGVIKDGQYDNIQNNQFISDMEINDIVLIKRGAQPIALVRVIGQLEEISQNDYEHIDWFRFRRTIEIIEILSETKYDFPSPRGTLKKSINKYTLTYQYIDNWYKKTQHKEGDQGLKLKSVNIKNYKIFDDFTINFTDNEDNILPIVIIAGKNGMGKTSIFEYITNLNLDNIYNISYELDSKYYDSLQNHLLFGTTKIQDNITPFLEHILYIPARTPNEEEIKSLDKLILDYVDYFIYEQSLTSAIGYENLQNDIDEIFEDFGLSFQFKKIDFKDKKALFEPYESSRDDIEFKLEQLSTGEKTLLFKVLNLYLQQAKNKVILIDEPELSLHPHWQNRVLSVYEKFAKINNNQIIIATHSPHIIGSAKNESIRILTKNGVINDVLAYGRDINSILFDAMGEVQYRPEEFRKKIDRLYYAIEEEKDFEKSQRLLNELEKDYGENDSVIIEAKMLIEMMQDEQ